MKKEFYFHIPQPCHEDWNKMTPSAKGRFCESCSKQVVDFSLMTDQEVLNFFSKSTGKVCGRFANDQLQRPLVEAKLQKKKTWWIAMIMPLLLLVNKVNAQKKNNFSTKGKTIINQRKSNPLILGAVLPKITPVESAKPKTECTTVGDTIRAINESVKEKKVTIRGKITDEKGEPIAFATLFIKGSKLGTTSDINGHYSLNISENSDFITLEISCIGFASKEISVSTKGNYGETVTPVYDCEGNLDHREVHANSICCTPAIAGEVLVVGAISHCKRVKKTDTLSAKIQKTFRIQFFKTYPNPVPKGSLVRIEIKKAGEYSIQLLDVNSKPILVQDFVATNDKAVTSINIPLSLAAGMYYIRVIDEKQKKQYAEKLIVQ